MQRLGQMRGHWEVTHHEVIHLGLFRSDFSPAAHLHNRYPYGVVLFTFARRMTALENGEMRSFDFFQSPLSTSPALPLPLSLFYSLLSLLSCCPYKWAPCLSDKSTSSSEWLPVGVCLWEVYSRGTYGYSAFKHPQLLFLSWKRDIWKFHFMKRDIRKYT